MVHRIVLTFEKIWSSRTLEAYKLSELNFCLY